MRLKPQPFSNVGFALLRTLCVAAHEFCGTAQEPANSATAEPSVGPWKVGIGEGFDRVAHEVELLAGGGIGMPITGSEHTHDWILGNLQYGWVFTELRGHDHWYRGNWELVGTLFGGEQFQP